MKEQTARAYNRQIRGGWIHRLERRNKLSKESIH